MLKRLWRPLLTLTLLALAAAGAAPAAVFKIATLSPDGSAWMTKMRAGAAEVKKHTEGRVTFKFYPGGVMGDDTAVLRKIRIGQLHGGALVTGSLARYFPDIQLYGVPFMFRNLEEVDQARARFDQELLEGLEANGFVGFGLAEGGFAYVMSTAPVTTIEDLQRRKLWIPTDDPAAQEITAAFDITPIPLSLADVRAGLQTGMIDTVATSPIGALALQWHTQIAYVTEVPLLYITGILAVDRRAFERLAPGDQAIVREVMGQVFADIDRQNRTDNAEALAALKDQGITFITPPEADLARWHAQAKAIGDRLVAVGALSADRLARLRECLQEWRAARQAEGS